MLQQTDEAVLYCPYCSYDLRSLAGTVCPECGGAVDEASLAKMQVPWAGRKEIGRVRAYLRTAWRVTVHTRRFCHAIARPVDYKAARKFQFVTVFLVTLAVTAIVWFWWRGMPNNAKQDFGLAFLGSPLLGTVALLSFFMAALLSLTFATGVHTYWLHPRHLSINMQNRAIALGYYACAPLLLFVLATLIMVAAIVILPLVLQHVRGFQDLIIAMVIIVVGVSMFAGFAAFWRVSFYMAGALARRSTLGRWSLLVAQPILVAGIAVLGLSIALLAPYVALIAIKM